MEENTTGSGEGKPNPAPENQQRGVAESPAAPVVVDEKKVREDAIKAERQRSTEIVGLCRSVNLPVEFSEKLVTDGATIEQARKLVIDELAKKEKPTGGPNAGAPSARGDEREGVRNAMIDGLMHRAKPGIIDLKDQAHDYKFSKLIDLARTCLEASGVRSLGLSPNEIVTRAIATTDYPILLGQTVKRFLRKFYDAQNFEWKKIASPVSAPDFRVKTGVDISGSVTFEEVGENGEYKNALSLVTGTASVQLKTYGRKITIGRKSIINDDLGVFNYLPNLIAQGASLFQAQKVWGLLTSNSKTPDGKAIFHVDHNNLAAGADKAAPSVATLSTARTAMWKQKTPAGDFYPIAPKYIVVPAELQTTAEQLMTAILATVVGNVNTFTNKYQIIVDPHLTNPNEWYLAGDPTMLQSLVYAYLEGEEGIHVESQVDFDKDAVVTKARLDFDAKAWDYRGWYKNPGL